MSCDDSTNASLGAVSGQQTSPGIDVTADTIQLQLPRTGSETNANALSRHFIDWFRRSSPDVAPTRLSSDGQLLPSYAKRFSVDTTIRDETNLVIHDVRMMDTGEYSCVRRGVEKIVARLSVFGKSPT